MEPIQNHICTIYINAKLVNNCENEDQVKVSDDS